MCSKTRQQDKLIYSLTHYVCSLLVTCRVFLTSARTFSLEMCSSGVKLGDPAGSQLPNSALDPPPVIWNPPP